MGATVRDAIQNDGSFYAKGPQVFRRPVSVKQADGTYTITTGFAVCCIYDHTPLQTAEMIARGLNIVVNGTMEPEKPE
jgi:hypothetical protein